MALGIPLTVTTLLGHQTFGLLIGTGVFTVLYGAGRPLRTRLVLLLTVGLAMVASVFVGTLTTGNPLVSIVVVAAIGMVATQISHALRLGAPGAFFFVLLAGVGGYLPAHGVHPGTLVAATAIGAAVAVVVAMSDLVVRPRGPQEDAVAAARTAVDAFVKAGSAAPDAELRSATATDALHDAWTTLADGGDPVSGDARARALVADLHRVQHTYSGFQLPGDVPDPELHAEVTEGPLGQPSVQRMLRRSLRWPTSALQAAVRVGAGVTIAGLIAWTAGTDHVYWAMAAAMLVLHNGLDRKNTMIRSVHRLVGTVLGLGLFLAVHALVDLGGPWVLVITLVVLQGAVELLVVRNYAAAVLFITPLALTIGTAGTGAAVGDVALERLLDTAIGITVAVAVPWLVFRRGTPGLVRAHLARVLTSAAAALDHLGAGTHRRPVGRAGLRDLAVDMQELSGVVRRGLQDDPDGIAELLEVREATAWLGFTVLARGCTQIEPASRMEGAAGACRRMAAQLRQGVVPAAEEVRAVRAAAGALGEDD
ncbi:FUSC family protein [Occultella aeris]|uniref:Fusaric acid resistance protein family protein n=1 Tax=Occultella aeris TaxID=2761496 RepID=A0A7M4DD20_9MICO|nr:Fusaric acid resistance protein family protein [Occultella aeris]